MIWRVHRLPSLNWTDIYPSNSYIRKWWHHLGVVIKHQLSNVKSGRHGGQLLFPITFLVIRLYITGTMACLIQIWNALLFFHMQREKLFPKVFNIFTVKHNSSLPEDVRCTKVWSRLYLALIIIYVFSWDEVNSCL